MRLKAASLLFIGCLSIVPLYVEAQSPRRVTSATDDGADKFLSAYQAYSRGETLEGQRDFPKALQAFKEASQLLNEVSTEHPQWNQNIVDFRRKRTAEAISRVQGKLGAGPSGGEVNPLGTLPPTADSSAPAEIPPFVDDQALPTGGRQAQSTAARPGREVRSTTPVDDDPVAQVRRRMDQAQEEIRQQREDLEKLRREREEALRRAKGAESGNQELEQKMKIVQQRADIAEKALQDVRSKGTQDAEKIQVQQAQLDKMRKELRDLEIQRDAELEVRNQTSTRLTVVGKRATSMEAERDAAQKTAEAERKRAEAAEKKAEVAIGEAQKRVEALVKERDGLMAKLNTALQERDVALAQVKQMSEAQKNVDKLVADNTQLMTKLSDAEKQITQFKADNAQKDVIIADLKKEVTAVKQQLAEVQKESATYQTQMAALQSRLEGTSKELAMAKTDGAKTAAERKQMTEENELLRGVVLRQMKKQADRDQTRKLVLSELAKMEVKSKDLLSKINYLGEPVVVLSPKERALFKKPQVEIGDNEIALAAPKETGEEATPAATEATSATGSGSSPSTPAEAPKISTEPTGGNDLPIIDRTPAKRAPEAQEVAMLNNKGLTPPGTGATLPTSPTPATGTTRPSSSETRPDGAGGRVTETSVGPSSVPSELQPIAQAAKDHFDRGNYRDAEKLYEKILDKAPSNLHALSNLGVVRFREGKLKLAEESFRKAVAIAPEDAFSRCTLGIIYYSQGRYDEAVTELTKSLAINPKYAAAHNFLGITASQKGWQDAAQKELETATSLDSNYADAHFNLAVVYATQQPADKEKARNHYKRATELGAESDSSLEALLK